MAPHTYASENAQIASTWFPEAWRECQQQDPKGPSTQLKGIYPKP